METTLTAPRSSGLRPGRIAAATVVALLALGTLALGVTGLWTTHADRGFFSSGTHRYASNGHAIVSDSLHVGSVPSWLVARIRIASTSADGKPTFVGIARKADVDRYLAGSAHSTVEDLNFGPFDVSYGSSPGSRTPARPGAQSFWAASAAGPGKQTLTWRIRSGHWRVVVMNADGSARVAADARIGASVWNPLVLSFIFLGVGLLLAGLVVAIVVRPRTETRIVPAQEAGPDGRE